MIVFGDLGDLSTFLIPWQIHMLIVVQARANGARGEGGSSSMSSVSCHSSRKNRDHDGEMMKRTDYSDRSMLCIL